MAGFSSSPYGSSSYFSGSSYSEASIGLSFNISAVQTYIGKPQSSFVFNEYDEFGLLLNLKRLPGEKNSIYRRRLFDTYTNRANSTYRGIVNAITREVGLSLFQPILISPVTIGGITNATNPNIIFDGATLYLYEDYENNILDIEFDRFDKGGNFEHLGSLVDAINNHSSYFSATLLSENYRYIRSMVVLNQTSRRRHTEQCQPSKKFQLEKRYIVSSSLIVNDRRLFTTEVSTEAEVTELGAFYLEPVNGILMSYLPPGIGTTISYSYNEINFKPWASPVIVEDISKESFKIKLFSQILGDNGTYFHGIPTELGVDIINELLSVTPMYWGV